MLFSSFLRVSRLFSLSTSDSNSSLKSNCIRLPSDFKEDEMSFRSFLDISCTLESCDSISSVLIDWSDVSKYVRNRLNVSAKSGGAPGGPCKVSGGDLSLLLRSDIVSDNKASSSDMAMVRCCKSDVE